MSGGRSTCETSLQQVLRIKFFGRWTAVGAADRPRYAACVCACGTRRDVLLNALLYNKSTHCGCQLVKKVIKSGEPVGYWIPLQLVERPPDRPGWRCRCVCGVERVVEVKRLRSGRSESCGCQRIRTTTRPGSERAIWRAMIGRCYDPDNSSYPEYGGAGIQVCRRWSIFENFLADVGCRPSPKHSLDRYPNRGGDYEPNNVRWATASEQARNTKRNILLMHDGKTLCLQAWAELTGLNYATLKRRYRLGWADSDVVTTPAGLGKGGRFKHHIMPPP